MFIVSLLLLRLLLHLHRVLLQLLLGQHWLLHLLLHWRRLLRLLLRHDIML